MYKHHTVTGTLKLTFLKIIGLFDIKIQTDKTLSYILFKCAHLNEILYEKTQCNDLLDFAKPSVKFNLQSDARHVNKYLPLNI